MSIAIKRCNFIIFTHAVHSIAQYMLRRCGWLAGCLSVTHRYCV